MRNQGRNVGRRAHIGRRVINRGFRPPGKPRPDVRGGERVSGMGSMRLDLSSGEARGSKSFYAIFGTTEALAAGRNLLLERAHPEDRDVVSDSIARAGNNGEPVGFDARVIRFDGPTRTVRVRGAAELDEGSGTLLLVATVEDVTDEVDARAGYELLTNLIESSEDAIITQERDGTIVSWNRGAELLYGYTAEEAIGRPITILDPPEGEGELREITEAVFDAGSVDRFETDRVRKDGRRIQVSLSVSPVTDASGTVTLASLIARDVTDRKRYEERLRYLADHDQLTGLLNRRRFEEELKRELARAGRNHVPGAVLSLDVDNFKSINDTAGHAAGDVVLVDVARVLKRRFRVSDVIARVGGDEFSVLLTDVTAEQARTAAEELLETIPSSCRPLFGGRSLRVAVSIGVAMFESDDATSDEVRVHADLAMYAAKSSGGAGVVVYSTSEGQQARAMLRQPWYERIRDALEHDRFVLHLQPILDLATGALTHGEFLLRMRDGHGGLISPGAFLPVAERRGLIHDVDRWVVRRAIALLANQTEPPPLTVGVNLSGDSVARDPQLLALIERELTRHGVPPSRLIFEITETAAIANMPEASRFAAGLRDLGCSLALDDFGTGFGSFYYLKHLPVGYLKLDGEFIQNLPRSPVDEHVVRAIVGVAQALGIKTVAESASDAETIRLLQQHGVDYAQGFHVGRPQPIEK